MVAFIGFCESVGASGTATVNGNKGSKEFVSGENSTTKTLYRGERSTVAPDSVFNNGFTLKGTHNDPLLHTKGNSTAGNFVSTSESMDIANGFAKKNGYFYVIETDNYVAINTTYKGLVEFKEQMEFSIPGGIAPNEVTGAYKKQGGIISEDFIPNPNYGGNK